MARRSDKGRRTGGGSRESRGAGGARDQRAGTPQPGGPIVAVLTKRGKIHQAEPAFSDEPNIFVGRKSLHGARSGELVVLRGDGRGRGEVVRRIGSADSLEAIMEAILVHYRVPRGFSERALEEAGAQAELAAREDPGRRDLTGLISFTIDPDEARDFDDAISLVDGPGEGEVTVYVHIADVSYFVEAGSPLDSEAGKKACSVYLPVTVEPMLPTVLSNDACSLKPDTERKCLTVEMIFEWDGPAGNRRVGAVDVAREELVPHKVSFYRSVIRSRRRLTYNQVDDFLAGVPLVGGESAELAMLLKRCRVFAGDLRTARHARGALNIHTFEPEFRLDEEGAVTGVRPRPESESHALIEEFMIAANEAVARFLEQRHGDCIYRVHEEPDAMAVDSLFDLLEELGVPVPPFSLKQGTPEQAGRAIRQLLKSLPDVLPEQHRGRSAFGEIVLRSLKQAHYLEDNLGHFGLASPAYLHFTSPIRRYPDLVVHRALTRELGLTDFSCSRLELAETAQLSSDNERRAALVERTGDDVVLAFLLDRLLYEEGWDRLFEGEVVSLINSGLFLRFEECYEGFVPARNLRGDYFSLSDTGGALIGRRSGRPFRLGDRMTVRVVRIDKLRGKVELEPAL